MHVLYLSSNDTLLLHVFSHLCLVRGVLVKKILEYEYFDTEKGVFQV